MRIVTPATTPTPAQRGRRSALKGVERLLWIVSLTLIATVSWMKLDAWQYQARAARVWSEARPADAANVGRPAPTSRLHLRTRETAGSPLGRLSIPRLDLTVMVAEGTTDDVLQHAVGHLEGSAYPGTDGNVVLAGHRDTFFRPLERIQVGDRIELDDGLRRYRYRVEATSVVAPDATGVVARGAEPLLTLVTCYPFRYIGPAPERFIVRARALPQEAQEAREENGAHAAPPSLPSGG